MVPIFTLTISMSIAMHLYSTFLPRLDSSSWLMLVSGIRQTRWCASLETRSQEFLHVSLFLLHCFHHCENDMSEVAH